MGSIFLWFAKFSGSFDAVSRNLGLNTAVYSLDKSVLVYDFMHLVQRNQSKVLFHVETNARKKLQPKLWGTSDTNWVCGPIPYFKCLGPNI